VKKCFFSFLFFLAQLSLFVQHSYALEFLYPVACTKNGEATKIYTIYQNSMGHIELWSWNPDSKVANKAILSSYSPAGFALLPNGTGFSFIDNGRIKIKTFHKRSAKSIEIYDPIYNICGMEWVDDEHFFISAKKNDKFTIFKIDTSGAIKWTLSHAEKDCMYPQQAANSLFYIERQLKKGVYKRDYLSYKIARLDNSTEQTKILETLNKEYILDFRSCPIAFLKMISEKEGFFLEHSSSVERHDKTIEFSYYRIKMNGNKWECGELFQFSIPAHLILDKSDSRLYESILPLLPKYHRGKLFYVDCSHNADLILDIFCYDIHKETCKQKTEAKLGQLFFSPLFVDGNLFYGGAVTTVGTEMWIDKNDSVCFNLPAISFPH